MRKILLQRRPAPPCAGRDESGSTSIQMVILMPALFAVMFLGMQAALWYHARTVAMAAAQQGAHAAGAQNGSQQAGVATATSFVAQAGGDDVLDAVQVTGSRSVTQATISVTGTSMSVVPGWTITVSQSATVPVERLTG